MTRVPKFRAWDKTDDEMVDVDEMSWTPNENGVMEFYGIGDFVTWGREPNQVDIMQSTGVKDKPVGSGWCSEVENRDIYEDDILQWEYSDGPELNQKGYAHVYWEKGAFRVKGKDVSDFTLDDFIDGVDWCEVVGNVYENKELLE